MLKNVLIIFQPHREIKHRQNQMLFVGTLKEETWLFPHTTFKVTAFDPLASFANLTPIF